MNPLGAHYINAAHAANQSGDAQKARQYAELAVAVVPDAAEAWFNLGLAQARLADRGGATASLLKARALAPESAEAQNSIGLKLMELGAQQQAEECYVRSIQLQPRYALPWGNLGNLRQLQRRFDEAESLLRKALDLEPDNPALHLNLSGALHEKGLHDLAAESIRRSLALDAQCVPAWQSLGAVYSAQKKFSAAVECYEKALAIDPTAPLARGLLLRNTMHLCDWHNHEAATQALRQNILKGDPATPPHETLSLFDEPALLLKAATTFTRAEFPTAPAPRIRKRRERLRIGYVSSDFRDHPVGKLLAEAIELHDVSRFEAIGLSLASAYDDPIQQHFRSAFHQFHDVHCMSDEELAQKARELELDIAIDLNGHTRGARTGAFALGLAPVQVSFLGYAGTMGAPFIDYLVTDRFVCPPGTQTHYTERLAYLPNCMMPHDNRRTIAPTSVSREQQGLPEHGFVFVCFNNHYKLTPTTFDMWMRILNRVKGSVLWLSDGDPLLKQNLAREAQSRGVDPSRLIYARRMDDPAEHLARIRLADLFLDTTPYNAHATALDALWAGVPLLTCPGRTFASRVAGSMLHTLGLDQLIAPHSHGYEELAVELAANPSLLASLRAQLGQPERRQRMFDGGRWMRGFESLLEGLAESPPRS